MDGCSGHMTPHGEKSIIQSMLDGSEILFPRSLCRSLKCSFFLLFFLAVAGSRHSATVLKEDDDEKKCLLYMTEGLRPRGSPLANC